MWKRVLGLLVLAAFPIITSAEEETSPPTRKTSPQTEWKQLCADHGVLAWYMEALDHPEALECIENLTSLPMLHLIEWGGDNDSFSILSISGMSSGCINSSTISSGMVFISSGV